MKSHLKSDVWDYRDQKHRLIDQATRSLANRTHMMAVSTTDTGEIHVHGVQYVLSHKEFEDVAKAREIFIRFEEPAFWERLLERFQLHEEDLLFLFDDDYEIEESASVFGEFQCGSVKGVIGVVGPRRMHYEMVVPNVRYFSHLLEELIPA
ncbi:MAG: Heat-inducible transcription repressor HrcA [Microgenomates bacterium OLB22]|nr:MAG: Heat-inducible transcription repressor HrcA [Microgenomates bacterium OLB22]